MYMLELFHFLPVITVNRVTIFNYAQLLQLDLGYETPSRVYHSNRNTVLRRGANLAPKVLAFICRNRDWRCRPFTPRTRSCGSSRGIHYILAIVHFTVLIIQDHCRIAVFTYVVSRICQFRTSTSLTTHKRISQRAIG